MFRLGARLISLSSRKHKYSSIIFKNDSTHWISEKKFSFKHDCRFIHTSEGTNVTDNIDRLHEFSTRQVLSITNSVKDLGFKEDEIKMLIQSQPDLFQVSSTVWNSILGSLVDSGFEKDYILSILEKWPHILFLKKSDLDKNLQAWFESGLGDELICNVLMTHPTLLQVNHNHLSKRVSQYKNYFESIKKVGKLLLLAPNALEENWDELLDKLNYLNELCTEKSDIISTGVLAHTALHVKARHEFLIRAGVYKRPTKDFRKRLSKNPKLTNIVNTSDKEFAHNVAGLTLFEYEVFLEMFEKELQENKSDLELSEEELNKLSYSKHLQKKSIN